MARFVFTVFALAALLISYMGQRLATHWAQWLLLLTLGALVLLFPLVHWARRGLLPAPLRSLLELLGYLGMGYASWVLVLAAARDLYLLGTFALLGREAAAHTAALTAGWPAFLLAFLLSLLGNFWAYRGLRLREVVVPVKGLPPALENLRIAQITDLHVGPTIGRGYVERVVAKVREAAPDLTVLTGDIFDGHPVPLAAAAAPLAGLVPAGRVFFAPGNHEYYHELPAWLPVLRALGVRPLLNEGAKLEAVGGEIWVAGITDPAAPVFGGEKPSPALAAKGGEGCGFRLLLSHRPGFVKEASSAGFHLQLSGHTHGGQFFPWTLVASRFHEFFLGLHRHNGTWLYVSPGTGSWGPPVRIGTTPELTLLRIVGENEAES